MESFNVMHVSTLDLVDDLLSVKSFLILAAIVFVFLKLIKIFSQPEAPSLVYNEANPKNPMAKLISSAPILDQIFDPPAIWGRNGHFQTITYGVLGHKKLKRTTDQRHSIVLEDGTTVTFDVIEPTKEHSEGDVTFCLCPGIANSSENAYIRTFFNYAQEAGYRCAVLNHLGALKHVTLTSPRIFTYGGTKEYSAMVENVLELYPQTRLVLVGFSMGGNIVTKYLGTLGKNVSRRIITGISVCQGYDANRACDCMHEWESFRRLYLYVMTENMKRLLRRNFSTAVMPHVKSGVVDEGKLFGATSLLVFDEEYSRKVSGFKTVEDYYRWSSCVHHLDTIDVPMIFVNALDDAIVPPKLHEPVKNLAARKDNVLFVLTKHGGHLGFLEGSSFAPKSVTWLDRMIVEVSNAALQVYGDEAAKAKTSSMASDGASSHCL